MAIEQYDYEWMQKALSLARHAESLDEVPVGAVIVINNELIAEGWNCPIQTHDPSAHAEMMALRIAAKHTQNYRLTEASLYVTLEPCIMCVGAMIHARIKRLIFATPDLKTGAVESCYDILKIPRLNHIIDYQGGVLADESAELLRSFFQMRRK